MASEGSFAAGHEMADQLRGGPAAPARVGRGRKTARLWSHRAAREPAGPCGRGESGRFPTRGGPSHGQARRVTGRVSAHRGDNRTAGTARPAARPRQNIDGITSVPWKSPRDVIPGRSIDNELRRIL